MSGPNTNYDPVQVSALDADQVEARVAEALEAIARASTTAELKQVRITHTGDRSALALANREIGALPPAAFDDLIGQVKALDMDDVRRQLAQEQAGASDGEAASSNNGN